MQPLPDRPALLIEHDEFAVGEEVVADRSDLCEELGEAVAHIGARCETPDARRDRA